MTLAVSDDFNRADSGTLGANWTEYTLGYSIVSNQVSPDSSSTCGAFWSTVCDSDDEYAQITAVDVKSATFWIHCRMGTIGTTDGTTGGGYALRYNGTTVQLISKAASGSGQTTLGSSAATTLAAGDTIGIRAVGTTLTGYVNGVQVVTATDSTWSGSGQRGIGFRTAGTRTLDDFLGGDYVSGGPTATIAWTEDDDTVAISATETITATAAWTEDDDTVAATVTETITAAAAWTEDDDTWAVAATYSGPALATVAWTEDDDAWAIAASYTPPPVSLTIAWTEDNDVWVVSASAPSSSYWFTTPTAEEQAVLDYATGLSWTRSVGITVVKTAGAYRQVRHPKQTELEAADTFYLGGHRYEVDATEAAALTTAGYAAYLTPA